jgi:hypothetical protein
MFLYPLVLLGASEPFAGSRTCRTCHQPQFAAHANSGHAESLARSSEHRLRSAFPRDAGEWAFGAGHQAVTFVDQIDEDHYVERGLSYYTAIRAMSLTPGHSSPAGERYRTFDPASGVLRCFQCHSTGPLRLAAGFRVEPFEPGVQCEACHGPGAEHTRTRAPLRNPGRFSAAELNRFCGACHRMPPPAGVEADWNNPWNVRHQPPYFSQSPCFLKSAGKLSCLTCHPPHSRTRRLAADHDRTCAGCHGKPVHRTNVAKASCVSCHMPAVQPQPNLRFTNHWIGIYEVGKPLRPAVSD